MNPNLKKYLWQFSGLYIAGYIIGITVSLFTNHFWHLKIQDFIIIISLAGALPIYTADKFFKNEGRYMDDIEQKKLVKKMSLIALGISIIPTLIYFGFGIVLKLILSAQDVASLLATTPISNGFKKVILLDNFALIGIILGSSILYYFLIRLSINGTFKRLRKKYNKNTLSAQ